MKQSIFFCLMAASLLGTSQAAAESFVFDGLNYELEDGKVYVGYNNEFEGDLVVPAYVSYDGVDYPVTAIGDWAFNYCQGITSVSFPETIERIGTQAFADCPGLVSVVIPDNVTALSDNAFAWSGVEEVTLSRNLTEIGQYVFSYCPNLKTVNLPDGLKEIGPGMFAGSSVEEMVFPEGLEVIGNYAFGDCYFFSELNLPSTVKRIEENAFCRCNFHDVVIPASVEYIGYYALGQLGEYQELGSLTIEDSDIPLQLDSYAFSGCYFTEYYQGRDLSHAIDFDIMYLRSLTTGGGCKKIDGFSITYDTLQEVTLHEGLEVIGEDFLSICYGLKNLVVPASVNVIGRGAMSIMQELDTLRFEDSDVPLVIEEYAMGICDPVYLYWGREIADPDIWMSIGGSRMEYLTIGGGCKTVTKTWSSKSALKEVVINEGVERIEEQGLSNSWMLEKVVLPSTITYIGESAFSYDSNLTDCVIPEAVEYIGDSAFSGTLIGDQSFGPNLSYLGGWSFANCKNLTHVDIPEGLETINWCTFMGTGLQDVTIPSSVKIIDTAAFGDCPDLAEITLLDDDEPIYLSSMGVFIGSPVQDLYVGRQVHGSHFTKSNLRNMTLAGGCKMIWGYNDAPVLQQLTLGPNAETIDNEAFSGCPSIVKITSEAMTPPALASDAFEQSVYDNALLYVPEGTENAYAEAISWKDFVNLPVGNGLTGISEDCDVFTVYTVNGVLVNSAADRDEVDNLPSGLYIINGRKVRK